jgi:hypothetical protein
MARSSRFSGVNSRTTASTELLARRPAPQNALIGKESVERFFAHAGFAFLHSKAIVPNLAHHCKYLAQTQK